MPASVKMQREYGDDLVVLFVESQGASAEVMESFSMSRKWLGTDAVWTTESPFRTGSNGLPNFALLGVEGELLLKGNPLSMKGDIEEAVDEQIRLAKSAPEGSPKSLKSAWKSFAKGDYAKAIAAAEKVAAKGKDDAEDATVTADEFRRRVERKIARVNWQLENGYAADGEKAARALAKACKGEDELYAQCEELLGRLESEEIEAEIEAAEALARIEKKLYEDGPDAKHEKALGKLAEKYSGTKVADRARKLAKVVGRAV